MSTEKSLDDLRKEQAAKRQAERDAEAKKVADAATEAEKQQNENRKVRAALYKFAAQDLLHVRKERGLHHFSPDPIEGEIWVDISIPNVGTVQSGPWSVTQNEKGENVFHHRTAKTGETNLRVNLQRGIVYVNDVEAAIDLLDAQTEEQTNSFNARRK